MIFFFSAEIGLCEKCCQWTLRFWFCIGLEKDIIAENEYFGVFITATEFVTDEFFSKIEDMLNVSSV